MHCKFLSSRNLECRPKVYVEHRYFQVPDFECIRIWAMARKHLMLCHTSPCSRIIIPEGWIPDGHTLSFQLHSDHKNRPDYPANIRSQRVHVPLSLTDTWQLYQYGRERAWVTILGTLVLLWKTKSEPLLSTRETLKTESREAENSTQWTFDFLVLIQMGNVYLVRAISNSQRPL